MDMLRALSYPPTRACTCSAHMTHELFHQENGKEALQIVKDCGGNSTLQIQAHKAQGVVPLNVSILDLVVWGYSWSFQCEKASHSLPKQPLLHHSP